VRKERRLLQLEQIRKIRERVARKRAKSDSSDELKKLRESRLESLAGSLVIEDRKSNATRVPTILMRVCGRCALLTVTSPFGKGGLRGISLGLKSPLAPLCYCSFILEPSP